MNTTALTFTVPAYQVEHSDGRYRDAIPVSAEDLPLDTLIEWFREQNNYTTPDAAAAAASLLLRQIGDRALDTRIITGGACAVALAAGHALRDGGPAVDPEYVWSAAADAEHRLQEHYPWADMQEYVVLPYDTRAEEIVVLCGECSAYLSNAERPDDGDYAAALDAVDSDVRAAERAPLSPRLRMHYGMIEAENTDGVCECCDRDLYDSPDDGLAHVWAY
jgi:hypothetical protein